jgi:hypothetical protein
MIVSKANLTQALRQLHAFDARDLSGSPFIGMQWTEQGLAFHRTSMLGLVESVHYDRTQPPTIVSLSHFRDVLANLENDEVKVDLDPNRRLRLVGGTGDYTKDFRVYTPGPGSPWATKHLHGEPKTHLPGDLFKGIDVSKLVMTTPPVHRRDRLMLITNDAILTRRQVPSTGTCYPREALLRVLGGREAEQMYVTTGDYWGVVQGGFRYLVSGHTGGDSVFNTYSVDASPLAEIPAGHLLSAMRSAANLTPDGGRIHFDAKTGISTRDQYNNPNVCSLGTLAPFTPLSITVRTAKVLCEALGQAREEIVMLGMTDRVTYRMTRGPWEATFRI